MPKWRLIILAFRPLNALLVAFLYALVWPHVPENEQKQFLFCMITVIAVMQGGYLVNDFYDTETDKLNQRFQNIFLQDIPPKWLWGLYALLSSIGLCGFLSLSAFPKGLLTAFIIVLLWVYAAYWKRVALLGNILVASLIGLAVWWAVENSSLPLSIKSYFVSFAWLLNLVREINKDAEDLSGDSQTKGKTLPIRIGLRSTAWFCLFLMAIGLVGCVICSSLFLSQKDPIFILIAHFISLIAAYTYILYLLLKSKKSTDFKSVSLWLKVLFLLGLLQIYWL